MQLSRTDYGVIAAARIIGSYDTVFVGVGRPGRAAALAYAAKPALTIVFESGIIGAAVASPPRSISDSRLTSGTRAAVISQSELFDCWLRSGRIDVAVVGAAQIDPYGRINTTVIGDYRNPSARLPGAGGSPDVKPARAAIVMLPHAAGRLVERVDFVTYRLSPAIDRWVVTDRCVFRAPPGAERFVQVETCTDWTPSDAAGVRSWVLEPALNCRIRSSPTGFEARMLPGLHHDDR